MQTNTVAEAECMRFPFKSDVCFGCAPIHCTQYTPEIIVYMRFPRCQDRVFFVLFPRSILCHAICFSRARLFLCVIQQSHKSWGNNYKSCQRRDRPIRHKLNSNLSEAFVLSLVGWLLFFYFLLLYSYTMRVKC